MCIVKQLSSTLGTIVLGGGQIERVMTSLVAYHVRTCVPARLSQRTKCAFLSIMGEKLSSPPSNVEVHALVSHLDIRTGPHWEGSMITAALLALALPAPTAPLPAVVVQDAPVRVWLNKRDGVERGDRLRVHVRTEEDGYLVVLHADPDGRIRMLFPLDPVADHFIRGGREYEVRGRGDRHTFTVRDSDGVGTIYAAYSPDPFRFDGLARGGHWDYTIGDFWRVHEDAEGELTAVVEQMASGAGFDYDIDSYEPYPVVAYRQRYHSGFYRSHFYDPFYCDPFYCSPFYLVGHHGYHPRIHIGIGLHFGYGYYRHYRPIYYDPYYDSYYYDPFLYGFGLGFYGYRGGFGFRHPRNAIFLGNPVRHNRGYTFKSPSRGSVESVQNRRRPTSGVGSRRPAAAPSTSPTRRTPATTTRRPSVSPGARQPATPRNRTPGRVRVRTPSNQSSAVPTERPRTGPTDVRSRRGIQAVEERGADGQTRRHYNIRIHGSARSQRGQTERRQAVERRAAPTQRSRPEARSNAGRTARPTQPSPTRRTLRAPARSGERSPRTAAPQRAPTRRPSVSRSRTSPRQPAARPSRSVRPSRSSPRVGTRSSARPSRSPARRTPSRSRGSSSRRRP